MLSFLTFKNFLNIAVFPGIRPRLEELFASGFQFIACFMAMVYGSVRLLPENHPYLNPANMGRFGIRHVIAEAANNLVFSFKNIDQIILFVCVMIGLILMIVQVLLLTAGFLIQPVSAMPAGIGGYFITPNPTNDIAHIMMDLVFGVPGIFDSCIATGVECAGNATGSPAGFSVQFPGLTLADGSPAPSIESIGPYKAGDSIFAPLGFPFPIHLAMHQMFQMYSIGLLLVAVLITMYFLVTIVAETAQTGTAFGKRFNKVWAPIRLVVAFGLLIPVGYGLNASQYIVLYAAKFGSGFASNGWILFNETLTGRYLDEYSSLASTPNVPEIGALLQFFYTARTCFHLEENTPGRGAPTPKNTVQMYVVRGPTPSASPPNFLLVNPSTSYDDLITAVGGDRAALIRFGIRNEESYALYRGNVLPTCGEVSLKLMDPRPSGEAEKGIEIMQKFYWNMIKDMWFNGFEGNIATAPMSAHRENYPRNTAAKHSGWITLPSPPMPPSDLQSDAASYYRKGLEAAMTDPSQSPLAQSLGSMGAIEAMAQSPRFSVDPVVQQKGWAAAAVWYNKIAELNGAVTTAVLNVPIPTKYPDIMEYVHYKKKQQDREVVFETRFEPILARGDPVPIRTANDRTKAQTLWVAFSFWNQGGAGTSSQNALTGNAVIDAINALFGTEGLYNIRRNPNTHPLAQLVGVGRSLVESSIRNLTTAVVGGAAGAGLSFIDQFFGKAVSTASKFLVTFAMVGLTAGFILFYVVPFLPFIYFFFAVGGWIKGIFEAMVGAPLWALAHIRIDNNGLAGQAAVNGYFLIFEIFLRPILIIFGILASISTYSALVAVLNQTFDLVTTNVGGFDHRAEAQGVTMDGETMQSSLQYARSVVDEFFFTVIYTIIVYLMGMSSFKLIDRIPNNILRWMGQSVSTFNDEREDAAQTLVGKATVGAQQTSSALGGGLKKLAGAGG